MALSWLERNAQRFERTDRHLLDFFERERGTLVRPLVLYCTGWVVRGVETWVFLQLLGLEVPFLTALVVETAIIVVRSVAVPVPAGLGVQDLAYVLTFLLALGLADATTLGTAFVVLKRGQGLFWTLFGLALLASARAALPPSPDLTRGPRPSGCPGRRPRGPGPGSPLRHRSPRRAGGAWRRWSGITVALAGRSASPARRRQLLEPAPSPRGASGPSSTMKTDGRRACAS